MPVRIVAALAVAFVFLAAAHAEDAVSPKIPIAIWSGDRAMADIAAQLTFGPRALDTAGHEREVEYIEGELAKTKAATVKGQQWIDTGEDGGFLGWAHRNSNTRHAMVNIVARFFPDNPNRVIVGTHYDSIIRAYRDKAHPDAPMPGANNSASGVALLLETARVLGSLPPPPVGIDLVFFDGEEGPKSLGAGDARWRPLGSPYFARHLEDFYPGAKPQKAVLFDMVCATNAELDPEPLSISAARTEVDKFWSLGGKIAPAVFKPAPYSYTIDDDHDALIKAGIPSFLVIGFKYEPWFNTTRDTIDKCSAATLADVGRTLLQYLYMK